ncbi:hypothetical protein KIN20_033010 [Parelaphostrongylus tenuis]|uniref:Uncharacterized protein n=1 Tax=Parelaphostrongylus tenuis TaxID=148309 RepID=A0AAD5R7E5_PARTN|nr:hypothetical protein KIN20_033010 [Parelaphostrongylus tenuis]
MRPIDKGIDDEEGILHVCQVRKPLDIAIINSCFAVIAHEWDVNGQTSNTDRKSNKDSLVSRSALLWELACYPQSQSRPLCLSVSKFLPFDAISKVVNGLVRGIQVRIEQLD